MSDLPVKLSEVEIKNQLKELKLDWDLVNEGKELTRTFEFKGYWKTIAFVNSLAWIAQAEGHHPDLAVHYGKVIVRYTTHDVDGLTENDFKCLRKIDLL